MPITLSQLTQAVQQGQLQPVYVLQGEEHFLLAQALKCIQEAALAGADPTLNLEVVYGEQVTAAQLKGLCRQYPTFAPRRVVVVKEFHRLRKPEAEKLVAYLAQPVPSTTLVLSSSDAKLPDARTAWGKALAQWPHRLEAKPLTEAQAGQWVQQQLAEAQLRAQPEAAALLVAHQGTQLSRLAHEVEKLRLQLGGTPGAAVTADHVYELTDIDRKYNIWELQARLAQRDAQGAYTVLHYLLNDIRQNPSIMLVAQLHGFYVKLGQALQSGARTEAAVASALRIAPFQARNYATACRHYSLAQVQQALAHIYSADQALKGIITTRMPEAHVMKTLLFQLVAGA